MKKNFVFSLYENFLRLQSVHSILPLQCCYTQYFLLFMIFDISKPPYTLLNLDNQVFFYVNCFQVPWIYV